MCVNKLSGDSISELDDYIDSLDEKEGELISILHKAQSIFGYLPMELQLHISRKLNIPAAKVNGVVTFYSYFTEVPKGKNIINVCLGTACFVRGSAVILEKVENKLGIKAGETTSDGKYSIDSLRCVGACGLAPVVMINEKVHGRVTVETIETLLKEIIQ